MGLANLKSGEETSRKPIVEMNCGEEDLLIFMDTGASVSLMGEDLYLKYFNHQHLTQTAQTICDIHTHKIDIVGVLKVKLQVAGKVVRDDVLVARGVNLGDMILLGHPACVSNGINVCPGKGGIVIEGDKDAVFVPYVEWNVKRTAVGSQNGGEDKEIHRLAEVLGQNYRVKGILRENVCLRPGVSQVVKLGVSGVQEGANVVVVEGSERIEGLVMVVTLNECVNKEILVKVVYNGECERKIKRGTYFADVEVFCLPIRVVKEEEWERVWWCEKLEKEERVMRENVFRDKLKGSDFEEGKEQLLDLLLEFTDMIALKGDKLGITNVLSHSIVLEKGTKPIYIPAYRIPIKLKAEVENIVEEWEEEGVVERSSSPFNFPLLVVPKKDGTHRVCVDFRKLNAVTVPDRYPAACMQDLIAQIGGKQIYSSIDLLQGFLQVPLEEESRPLTAFSTTKGHYQFLRMPFGLQGSPITFTRLVNTVFHGLLGKAIHIYMDDLLIATDTVEEHLEILREVLNRLRAAGLKLKLAKCDFLKREIVYLGHIISESGVRVNPAKIKAISDFPEPKTKKNIKQFLGLSGFFRRFVRGFSTIAAPLTDVLKEDVPFSWGEKERSAFMKLKDALGQPPVLRFPNFDLPFIVVTDASDLGMGACLMQKWGKNIHPVAFFSRKWKTRSPDETKLSVVDKEAYAVVAALQHFRYMILGYNVTVFTDHKPLLELFNKPNISPRRARWFVTINDFSPKFEYIEGKSNLVADSLSRNIQDEDLGVYVVEGQQVEWNEQLVIQEQDTDEICFRAKQFLRGHLRDKKYRLPTSGLELSGNLLVRRINFRTRSASEDETIQVVVPRKLVSTALRIVHELMGGDHCGVDRTYAQARKRYFWKGMYADIKNYIKNCGVCNSCKPSGGSFTGVASYPIPSKPFERVHMDLLAHFCESGMGNKHLLVIIDELTRYTEIYPIKNKTAEEVAIGFFNGFICRHGVPRVVVSDNGREFVNKIFDSLSELMKIKRVNILPYRPEANGVCERANRKILEALRTTVGGQDPNWDRFIDYVRFSINSALNESIGMSPHEALYGVEVRNPFDFFSVPVKCEEPVDTLLRSAQNRFAVLRENLGGATEAMKKRVNVGRNKGELFFGDKVYVKINVRNQLNYKLGPKFEGPFEVIDHLVGNRYRVKRVDTEVEKVVHVSQLKVVGGSDKQKRVRFLL